MFRSAFKSKANRARSHSSRLRWTALQKKLRLTVVLPNNATIPAQPTVANEDAGQDEVKLAWHRCMPGGCFADALLPDDVVKAWRNSTEQGRITFRDGLGRDIGVPISFRGLSPALDALVKQN